MRKIVGDPLYDIPPPRRGRSGRRIAMALALVALSPFAFEAVLICASSWGELLGRGGFDVRTPALDALREVRTGLAREVVALIKPTFSRIPWDPDLVLPIGLVWAFLASLLLRRR